MTRRPPASDEEAKEPPASPATDAPPSWPASAPSEKVEVALFIIPGPAKPWSSVVDVRHASRIQIAGFESPAIEVSPPLEARPAVSPAASQVVEQSGEATGATAEELLLNAEAVRSASGTVADLELFADDNVDALAAFPSESLEAFPAAVEDEVEPDSRVPVAAPPPATSPWVAYGAATTAAKLAAARLWSRSASGLARLRSAAAACSARTIGAAALRFGPEARARAWRSGVAASDALKQTVAGAWSKTRQNLAAAHSAVVLPAIGRLAASHPWSRTRMRVAAGWSAFAAWLQASPRPAAWRAEASRLQSRAASRVRTWQAGVATMPVPRRRQLGLGLAAAAAVLLAVGVTRVALLTLAIPEPASQLAEGATLSVRPLGVVASLAPSLGVSAAVREPAEPAEPDRRAEPSASRSPGPAANAPGTGPATGREPNDPRSVRVPPVADDSSRGGAGGAVDQRPTAAASPTAAAVIPVPAAAESVAANTVPTPAAAMPGEIARAPASAPSPDAASEAPSRAPVSPPVADPAPPADIALPAGEESASDGIAEALKHLQIAYERRDATLAKEVWPTVDERALARAFDGLRSQSVTFDRCQLNVSGAAGEVECRGVTRYVPRVGGQYQRVESRQWRFRVEKAADSWLITSAAAR